MLKQVADRVIEKAATNDKIDQEVLYKNIVKNNRYTAEIARLLEHRSSEVTDNIQKKNIEDLVEKIRNNQPETKEITRKSRKMQKMIMTI